MFLTLTHVFDFMNNGRDMFKNGELQTDYFSSLGLTVLTLYQIMTFDSWASVVREVMETKPWAWMPFLVYAILTGIIVTNLVVAVICDSVFQEHGAKENTEEHNMEIRIRKEIHIEMMNLLKDEISGAKNSSSRCRETSPPLSISSQNIFPSIDVESGCIKNSNDEPSNESMMTKKGLRKQCGEIVNSKHVESFIITLIIINSLMMAVGTTDMVKTDDSTQSVFNTIDFTFLIIYTVESGMQLFYHGKQIFKHKWASFDLFLVIMSWIIEYPLNGAIPVQAVRALRLLRLLRLVPKLRSLKIYISAVIEVLPKLGGIGGILLLIFYIFAIFFTELFKEYNAFFCTLDATMFTLFQLMTMVDWSAISRQLAEHVSWAPLLVSSFITITGFIFLNLVISLICEAIESINEMTASEEEATLKTSSGRSILVPKDSMQECIEECQNEIHDLLKSCTIIPNQRVASVLQSSDEKRDAECTHKLDGGEDLCVTSHFGTL